MCKDKSKTYHSYQYSNKSQRAIKENIKVNKRNKVFNPYQYRKICQKIVKRRYKSKIY